MSYPVISVSRSFQTVNLRYGCSGMSWQTHSPSAARSMIARRKEFSSRRDRSVSLRSVMSLKTIWQAGRPS